MKTVSGHKPSTTSVSQERPSGSPAFRAIGIPALAAATVKRVAPNHKEVQKDLPPLLRKGVFED